MASIDDIVQSLPIDQIARRLGVDPATARKAVESALPALVGGLKRNASDEAGASSLANAVATKDPGLVDGEVPLESVDEGDGEKIVGHVFGDESENVAQALGDQGVEPSLIKKLLPILAPVVLAYLAKQVGPKGTAGRGGAASSAGPLQDILGSLLGSGSQGKPDIGDLLGSILGSKR